MGGIGVFWFISFSTLKMIPLFNCDKNIMIINNIL